MNFRPEMLEPVDAEPSFRPQQGLLIMNWNIIRYATDNHIDGFRPQQGLLIMNFRVENEIWQNLQRIVSVPNRGYLL